jgi:hypothetical protein
VIKDLFCLTLDIKKDTYAEVDELEECNVLSHIVVKSCVCFVNTQACTLALSLSPSRRPSLKVFPF